MQVLNSTLTVSYAPATARSVIPVAIQIRRCDRHGGRARGVVERAGEGAVAVVEQHAHRILIRARGDEVDRAVTVQVRRRDPDSRSAYCEGDVGPPIAVQIRRGEGAGVRGGHAVAGLGSEGAVAVVEAHA
jgi:hypothetical protein